jgi:solute carrier family 25 phosphate transporter 3
LLEPEPQHAWCRLYKGLQPLWGRQIPYTMMKFACFENTVEALYKYVVPKTKAECSKQEQLGVSFVAGYIAGIFCAVVSQPADNLVSKLNSQPGATAGGEPPTVDNLE